MPIRSMILAAMGLSLVASSLAPAAEMLLAEGGKSAYRIVVAEDASTATKHAAEELQTFVEQISGAKLPILLDREPIGPREIILGQSAHFRAVPVDFDPAACGKEGYLIRTVGNHLVIAGGEPRGTLYGVYGLLQDHLGCRWFAPGVSRIPKRARLALGPIHDRHQPVLEYREPYTFDCFDGDWCARNRVNSSGGRLEEKHGGKIRFGSGFFVHTFSRLVPPEKYFDAHPEYFSLIKGKRLKERSQLCCTNEEVVRLCTEGIRAAMRAQPEAFVFSVSQNDWHNYCECGKCQELAGREQSQMAPVLQLVNRVAEAVEQEFPQQVVETLAYQWTRKPPRQLRPRPNVIIRLCSIECCFSHPLATCDSPANRAFCEDLAAWAKTGARLWVWDYVTDFRHYLLPFPNQRVRRANIRLFVEHHVTGIMEQDTYNTPHSELAELGGYLTAKFLWNPDYDPQQASDEFLAGYYGQAAGPIRAYLDLLHERVVRENIHINIWAGPESPHLSDELLLKANQLWQQAEDCAAGPETLRRVKLSRMSVEYAVVERARLQTAGKLPADEQLRALAHERLGPFLRVLKNSGLNRLQESKPLDFNDYQQKLAAALQWERAK